MMKMMLGTTEPSSSRAHETTGNAKGKPMVRTLRKAVQKHAIKSFLCD
jgi:hypothetical protein